MRLDFGWIEPDRLAASSFPSTLDDLRWLKLQGIRAVVTLTEYSLIESGAITPQHVIETGMMTFHAPISDMRAPKEADFTHQVMKFIDRMQQENKPVLVHCLAGVGRTGTMLHAYYLHRGLSLRTAKKKLFDLRPGSSWREFTPVQQEYLTGLEANLKRNR